MGDQYLAESVKGMYNYVNITNSLIHLYLSQRWARAYRDTSYHGAVETNNGAEALNRVLKYKYLPRRKHMMLSDIMTTIIEEFLPALHHKYIYQNFKQSDMYRTYNPAVVPSYLQGRPKATILHCLHRQAKSNAFTERDVCSLEEGKFTVRGTYMTDFGVASGEPSCSCKDWIKHKIPCKHFFAVFRLHPEWSWERLPSQYLRSPYLTLDTAAVEQYVNKQDLPDQEMDTAGSGRDEHSPGEELTHLELSKNETIFDEIPRKVFIIILNTYILNNTYTTGEEVSREDSPGSQSNSEDFDNLKLFQSRYCCSRTVCQQTRLT